MTDTITPVLSRIDADLPQALDRLVGRCLAHSVHIDRSRACTADLSRPPPTGWSRS